MRIVYHLGVHCTDDERLIRCLLRNRGALAAQGIVVPGPARYRTLLRDTAMQLRGHAATRDAQALILDQIMDEDRADRLVLNWENFLGYAQNAVRDRLYPAGPERMFAFSRIFPDIEHEFHLAIRNPATWLPAIAAKQKTQSREDFAAGIDPFALRWSDLVSALREACPDVPVTLWCDEDTPLLWPDVLATVSGHAGEALEGEGELLASIMAPEGLAQLQAELAAAPPADAEARRRVTAGYLGRFAMPEAVEMDIDLPGWTDETVAELGRAYDADVVRIMGMEGVRVLLP